MYQSNHTKIQRRIFLTISSLFFCTFSLHAAPVNNAIEMKKENVIVIHGFGQDAKGMAFISETLEKEGFNVCPLEYKTIGKSIDKIKAQVSDQIDDCFTHFDTSYKTHFIGHSLGGLMIRNYFSENPNNYKNKQVDKIVLMGTPNQGSPISDVYKRRNLFGMLGEMSMALGTGEDDFANSLPEPSYPIAIIAGNKPWRITKAIFNEPNDGLVPVSSTKLENMSDFIELPIDHAGMRSDQDVMNEILVYLHKGKFSK